MLVVDDGSTDSTAEIAKALGAIVISHSSNRGYGAALQTIFDVARKLDADTLVILDSDGQHDPEQIPALLKPLRKGVDVVIGSRFIGKNGNHIPAYRIVGMKILDTATNLAGNLGLSDTQSGFRAYGKNAIATIKVSGNGMSAGSEILFQAQDQHFSVAEVPISVKYDVEKPSTQNPLSHGLDVLSHIIGIVGYKRPLITFGVPGCILTVFGAVTTLYTVTELYTGGAFHSVMFIGGITSLILGLLLVTTSLILNSLVQIVKMEK
ncbi:MAG: Undecaprenyl-phosphate mannosyltransferase [Syntrophorhabdus sp. PtaB.Bin027]|nr:MAG: Undecaprenyl-phosphate mannosyltransferase [Syntrophorhabdus sp. PtaB.Bin027]